MHAKHRAQGNSSSRILIILKLLCLERSWGATLLLLLLMVLSLFCCIVAFMLRQFIARRQLMDLAIHENTENTFYVGRDMKTSVGVVVTLV